MTAYPPAAAEPLEIRTRNGIELHWPDAYGQHCHHKAGLDCECHPTLATDGADR